MKLHELTENVKPNIVQMSWNEILAQFKQDIQNELNNDDDDMDVVYDTVETYGATFLKKIKASSNNFPIDVQQSLGTDYYGFISLCSILQLSNQEINLTKKHVDLFLEQLLYADNDHYAEQFAYTAENFCNSATTKEIRDYFLIRTALAYPNVIHILLKPFLTPGEQLDLSKENIHALVHGGLFPEKLLGQPNWPDVRESIIETPTDDDIQNYLDDLLYEVGFTD